MFPNCLYLSNGSTRVFFLLSIFPERNLFKEPPMFFSLKSKAFFLQQLWMQFKNLHFLATFKGLFFSLPITKPLKGAAAHVYLIVKAFAVLHICISKSVNLYFSFETSLRPTLLGFLCLSGRQALPWLFYAHCAYLCTSKHPIILICSTAFDQPTLPYSMQYCNYTIAAKSNASRSIFHILLQCHLSDITPVSYFH